MLEKLFLQLFRAWSNLNKLLTTYTKFKVDEDGAVKGSYKIHGTNTGRLSSNKPNMQNIPKEVRKLFVAPEGEVYVQADYSNLELRVLSFVSDDDKLQAVFEEGKNAHDENTKDLFGLSPEDADWKLARGAAKTYIFGRNYGGGLRGIFQRVAMAVPELGLTYRQFVEADRRYRAAHPAYEKWANETVERTQTTRTARNAFGRVRFFLGSMEEIAREGLNTPIQSTAADILNRAIICTLGSLPREMALCATVHDSIIVRCPKYQKEEAGRILKECMEQEFVVNGYQTVFPVDIEWGESWGVMEPLEV